MFSESREMFGGQSSTTISYALFTAFNAFFSRERLCFMRDKKMSKSRNVMFAGIKSRLSKSLARIALVKAVQTVLKEGLYLLGIKAPEAM